MNEMAGERTRTVEPDERDSEEESKPSSRKKPSVIEQDSVPKNEFGEALHKRFLVVGDRYYYRDRANTVAFEDKGTRLTTDVQDASVVYGMILRAREKGWTSLHVNGSDAFKAEAWLQARLAGLSVEGYRAHDMDEAKLADRMKEMPQRPSRDRRVTPEEQPVEADKTVGARHGRPLTSKQELALRTLEAVLVERGDSPAMRAAVVKEATERLRGERVLVGRIHAQGIDHYAHQPENDRSYYVTLETEDGVKEVWGRNLARALERSESKPGDRVALVQKRRDPVVVTVPVRDEQGRMTESVSRTVFRNTWEVVNLDRMGEQERERTLRAAKEADRDPVVPVYDHQAVRRGPEPVLAETKRHERVRDGR